MSEIDRNSIISSIPNTEDTKLLIGVEIRANDTKLLFRLPADTLVRELLRRVFIKNGMDTIEYMNYGLYIPSSDLQKGKFLQEERLLIEYPQLVSTVDPNEYVEHSTSTISEVPTLRLLPKLRFMDELPISLQKLNSINSKFKQKRFMSAIKSHNLRRINSMLDANFDPNFLHSSSKDTPLCLAAVQHDPKSMILKLVEKGAYLEYRDGNTHTPLHRAAIVGNQPAIRVLLELGLNPNVRDCRDLTPLYLAVSRDVDTACVKQLLFDHSVLGVTDKRNRQEIHQACLADQPEHLKQLIRYGADLNAQTSNLDTPLHICALNNHRSCVTILMSNGADRDIHNASGQTASDVALLTGLSELAEYIDTYSERLIEFPEGEYLYNQNRRPSFIGPRGAIDEAEKREASTMRVSYRNGNSSVMDRRSSDIDGRIYKPVNVRQKQRSSISVPSGYFLYAVELEDIETGLGFDLRGLDVQYPDDFTRPATQIIDRVYPYSAAAYAGIQPGDYLISVNEIDVQFASHATVVDILSNPCYERLKLTLMNSYTSQSRPRSHRSIELPQVRDGRRSRNRSLSEHRTISLDSSSYSYAMNQQNNNSDIPSVRYVQPRFASLETVNKSSKRKVDDEKVIIIRSESRRFPLHAPPARTDSNSDVDFAPTINEISTESRSRMRDALQISLIRSPISSEDELNFVSRHEKTSQPRYKSSTSFRINNGQFNSQYTNTVDI